jgi:hypothetical protein
MFSALSSSPLLFIHPSIQSRRQSLRSLDTVPRYTTTTSIHLHSQQLLSHHIPSSPWLSVLGLQSSLSSLAVVHSSAFLEQWDGSTVEKVRMSMAQTMAGGLPTIKATICEKLDKRTTRACSMSQDIMTELRVR